MLEFTVAIRMTKSSAILSRPVPTAAARARANVYQPQLDGLRAVAILGVLFEHFGLVLPDLLRCGPLCVRFFFVLSGYFITLSLWRIQNEVREKGSDTFGSVCRFYLARLLRIGPPFYLALI